MKDKDPNEDEFNQEDQDNINEADDSFGLPDLDFDTLEEAGEEEEEGEKQEESTATEADAGTEDTAAETTADTDTTDDEPEAAEPEITEEETAAAEATDEGGDESEPADEEEATAEAEPAVAAEEAAPRTYVPPKPESNAPKMIAVILAVIVVSVGVWYFMFYRPQAQAEAEKARIEAEAKKLAAEKKKAEARKLAEERKKAEAEANQAADADEAAATSTNEGTFSTISAPTGRYYVIIESFVDSDLAADYGNRLAADGVSTTLLAPLEGKKKLHRLALGDYGSFAEAQDAANKLKAEFGENLWVLKY